MYARSNRGEGNGPRPGDGQDGEAAIDRSISIVLPAFNEEQRLPRTLDRLAAWAGSGVDPVEVIVVDDGSTDGTADLVAARSASDPSVRLVSMERNLGKGAALARGFGAATQEFVLFLDADLPVPTTTIDMLLDLAGDVDLVLGSRRESGSSFVSGQPLPRRIGGWGFRRAATLLGYRLTSDPQCGIKLLRRQAMSDVVTDCVSPRFAFDIEMITRSQRRGVAWRETAVEWEHVPGSSLRPVRDAVTTLRDLVVLRRRLSLRSTPTQVGRFAAVRE